MLFIDDIWKYHIFKYVNLQLFKLYEIKSICQYFNRLLPSYKKKKGSQFAFKYIKVPSKQCPTLDDAYNLLKKCKQKYKKIPEIWLDEGIHHHNIECIEFPILISGVDKKNTIIQNCLTFSRINEKYHGKSYLYNLSINNSKTNGIVVHNSNINIYNCIISNNAKSGLHIWNNVYFYLNKCEINGNQTGLLVGNTTTGTIKNIYCYNNKASGISSGGCDFSKIHIKGKNTKIYNNNTDKNKYSAGIYCDYACTIQIYNLTKMISNSNFNNYVLRGRRCKIIFKNKNSENEIVQSRTQERDYYY